MKKIIGNVVFFKAPNVKVEYSISWIDKKYKKNLKRNVVIMGHSEYDLSIGDRVVLRSCSPISKKKKYVVVKE